MNIYVLFIISLFLLILVRNFFYVAFKKFEEEVRHSTRRLMKTDTCSISTYQISIKRGMGLIETKYL